MPSENCRSARKALRIAAAVVVAVVVDMAFSAGADRAGVQSSLPGKPPGASALVEPPPFGGALLAKGKFLVASSTLSDPWFRETVVLLIGYDASGVNGLIINRPTKVTLAEAITSVPGLKKRHDVLYFGGPVESQRMFMLVRSDQKPEESDTVIRGVHVSMSRKTLERMIDAQKTEKQFRVYSGYAGWLPGQLNREVLRGDWYIIDADAETIFEKKESELWRELIDRSSSIQVDRAIERVAGRAAR